MKIGQNEIVYCKDMMCVTGIILPAHPESLKHNFSQGLISFTKHESQDAWILVERNLRTLHGTLFLTGMHFL